MQANKEPTKTEDIAPVAQGFLEALLTLVSHPP